MSITANIKRIQNIMRKEPGLDGDAQRIHQLSWLLLLKAIDENPSTKTMLKSEYRWSNWTKSELNEKSLIDFINDNLFPYLKGVGKQESENEFLKIINSVFNGMNNYMTSEKLFRDVIEQIDISTVFRSSTYSYIYCIQNLST